MLHHVFYVYQNAELQGTLITYVLNTIVFTYDSIPTVHFPPRHFCTNTQLFFSEMNKQNVVAHPFHLLVDCACCESDVCLGLEELYMPLLGLCNQCVRVHLLGVFMYVSMCICTHSCPCHCVSQTELWTFSLRATHVFPWATRRP